MKHYVVNSPSVMHETIEGEVILIDLTTGSYYSLRDAGATIWQTLEHGAGVDGIVRALEQRYDGAADELRTAAEAMLLQLESEALIRVEARHDGSEPHPPHPPHPPRESEAASRSQFYSPVLEKHTDMQDLILLDPVHQVGERGWPQPAEQAAESS